MNFSGDKIIYKNLSLLLIFNATATFYCVCSKVLEQHGAIKIAANFTFNLPIDLTEKKKSVQRVYFWILVLSEMQSGMNSEVSIKVISRQISVNWTGVAKPNYRDAFRRMRLCLVRPSALICGAHALVRLLRAGTCAEKWAEMGIKKTRGWSTERESELWRLAGEKHKIKQALWARHCSLLIVWHSIKLRCVLHLQKHESF